MPRKTAKIDLKNRAAVYIRVSTDEQAEDGYGLDVQLERCTAQAIAKGLTVLKVFEDKGISGTKGETDRPGLAALLASVDAGEIDYVIVLSLDRLGRKTSLVLNLVERITSKGVSLISTKETLDTSNPMGQFVLTILAGLAQLERDTIVERTTAGRNLRGKRDGEKGGELFYGYTRKSGKVKVDRKAAEIVREIFALRQQGKTLQAIADNLTERGLKPPKGQKWYRSSIKAILDNEGAYRGNLRGESSVSWPTILAV